MRRSASQEPVVSTPSLAAVLLVSVLVSAFVSVFVSAPTAAQLNGTLLTDNGRLQGTDPGGRLLLYTPDPVQLGSSISHWDTSATPNLLMEPSINPDLALFDLDVTPALMEDIGWAAGTHNVNVFDLGAPGTGFTDPTPFPGAPGNPALTLGEARVNLFLAVLTVLATTLDSAVDVDVLVAWIPQFCDPALGAVLAGAQALFVINSPGFPQAATWYHAALAEAFLGVDITGSPTTGGGDIIVFMNSAIDQSCLGPGTGFYYGLDGNPPPNQLDVSPVVLHELAHGYGHSNFTNETTGAQLLGLPGIYDLFTLDLETGLAWDQMGDAERVESATRFRKVVWDGGAATAAAASTLDPGVMQLVINSPSSAVGSYEVGLASFGAPFPDAGLSGELVCQLDSETSVFDGCQAATNPGELTGNLALIDRGLCNFTTKVANAQAAGAAAAIIIDTSSNQPVALGGVDPTITIPAVSVGASDGALFRSIACPGIGLVPEIPSLSLLGKLVMGLLLLMLGVVLLRRTAG